MKHYSSGENIADIQIRIFARNDEDLVTNTMYAVATLIHRVAGLRTNVKSEYHTTYDTPEKAAVDLANHVITEFEISNTLYYATRNVSMEMGNLSAQLRGHHFSRPPTQRNVLKAVTYHNLHYVKMPGYLDITIDV